MIKKAAVNFKPERGPFWFGAFIVWSVTFLVFARALRNGFVWDDTANLVENLNFRGLDVTHLKWMLTTVAGGPYQPLTWLSFAVDYLLWGLNPAGFHVTNIIFHALNASLLYAICMKLFLIGDKNRLPSQGTVLPAAMFSALFFSIHPLRVESVAWVTERRDVLSGFFYLLAIFFYLRRADADSRERILWAPFFSFLLAVLAKGSAISLPFVLLLLDAYPLKRFRFGATIKAAAHSVVWREKWAFFVVAAVAGAAGLWGQMKFGGMQTVGSLGTGSRLMLAMFSASFYLYKTLVPGGLIPLYEMPEPFNPYAPDLLLGAFTFILIGVIALYRAKSWPAVSSLFAYFIISLVPVSGIVKFGQQLVADRYSYLPSIGVAIGLGIAFLKLSEAGQVFQRSGVICLTFVITGLGYLTYRQNGFWQDEATLWSHALSVRPDQPIVNYTLATVLDKNGRKDKAINFYVRAARLQPRYIDGYFGLAGNFFQSGQVEEAKRFFEIILKVDEKNAVAHNDLGAVLAQQGQVDQAIRHFREALKLAPNNRDAQNNLSSILERKYGN